MGYEKMLEQAQYTPTTHIELPKDPDFISLDFHVEEGLSIETTQYRKRYIQALQKWISRSENYIDRGGAGRVFSLNDTGLCIKVMENRHSRMDAKKYNLGNSVYKESLFLRDLSHFSCEGVRSPFFFEYFVGKNYTAIIMEQLDAINLEHIIQGKQAFPEEYDRDVFCDRLGIYIEALHNEARVAHGDFFARNVMVDKITGDPYVIDFGRSIDLDEIEDEQKRYTYELDDEERYEEICRQLASI